MALPADNLVCIGVGVRAHGIRGEVRVSILSELPGRIKKGMTLEWRRSGHDTYVLNVSGVRERTEKVFLRFQEIPDRTAAETLNGGKLWGAGDTAPDLEEDAYFHHQILGLDVVDEDGNSLGELVAVMEMGAHDNYEIRQPDGTTFLLPAVAEFILDVDLDAGRMVVRLIPGLLPEAEPTPPKKSRRRRRAR
jgi:16S rRNA processing protein RimM